MLDVCSIVNVMHAGVLISANRMYAIARMRYERWRDSFPDIG